MHIALLMLGWYFGVGLVFFIAVWVNKDFLKPEDTLRNILGVIVILLVLWPVWLTIIAADKVTTYNRRNTFRRK